MRSTKLGFYAAMVLVGCAIAASRYYEVDEPVWRLLTGGRKIDPATLHLKGEFVESNLGTALEPDGSVTVRLVAEQYFFVPQCVMVPAGVPVRLRITSADAVHKLLIEGTDDSAKVVPGAVTEARFQFAQPGEYQVPCKEFCGAGHYAMRSEWMVVDRNQFPNLRPEERGNCAPR